MQAALWVAARRLQGGQQPNHQADDGGDDQCEGEDCAIDVDRSGTGQIRRTECDQRAHADFRNGHSESAGDGGEQQTFGEELPNQAHASCAKRGTHGKFTAPPRARCEQKIRHIHTHDQQHQADRAKNRQQSRFHGERQVVLKPIDHHSIRGTARAFISLGIGLSEWAQDYVQFIPGLIAADARRNRPTIRK